MLLACPTSRTLLIVFNALNVRANRDADINSGTIKYMKRTDTLLYDAGAIKCSRRYILRYVERKTYST